MALRSRYRERPADNIPVEAPAPSEKIDIEVHDTAVPDVAAIEPADEAGAVLKRQLQHLRDTERAQHEHAMRIQAAQMAQRGQPQTRVEFLQSQGLTKQEAEFFDSREDMMANQQQASEAAAEALAAGIERDSPQFFEAVEQGFAKRAEAMNQQPAEQPTPAFFQPRSVSPSPAAPPDRSSLYAAPVSRTAPSGSPREPSPSQVRLTPEEMQIAAASGISHTEYARHKLTMLKRKASGELQ
jgi:hypothetical protein